MPKMPPGTYDELKNRFAYHKPSNDGYVERCEQIREKCLELAMFFYMKTGATSTREQSVAITKVEEAMMWAIAGVVRNQ